MRVKRGEAELLTASDSEHNWELARFAGWRCREAQRRR